MVTLKVVAWGEGAMKTRGREILVYAVLSPEGEHFAPHFFRFPAGDDLGNIRSGLFRGPFAAVNAFLEGDGSQFHGGARSVGSQETGLHFGVGYGLVLFVA